jgi:hypothetical protein
MAALHELTGLEVGGHGLIVLVLNGKAVAVGQPGRAKQPVQLCCLAQVPGIRYTLFFMPVLLSFFPSVRDKDTDLHNE